MDRRGPPVVSARELIILLMGVPLPARPFIATKRIVAVLSELGHEPGAVRVALSRLTSEGLVERQRAGRETAYRLHPIQARTTASIHERVRAFGHDLDWDGRWTVVSFSVPEELRNIRAQLKTRLVYMGFGRLREGAWCATRNCDGELKDLIASLGLGPWIDVFVGHPSPPEDLDELMRRCWDLDELATGYRAFVEEFTSLTRVTKVRALSDQVALASWVAAVDRYYTLVNHDPELPPELLPVKPREHRAKAVATFAGIHRVLWPRAQARVLTVFDLV